MSVKITYFVHGTTTDNEKNISFGWFDVSFSEKGIIVNHFNNRSFPCNFLSSK